MNPHHDGSAFLRRLRCRPDIQIQTVFADLFGFTRPRLNAGERELGGIARVTPGHNGCWRLPAKLSNWRRGERDAAKHRESLLSLAVNAAACYVRILNCRIRRASPEKQHDR